jgi:hypothetical protein
MLTGASETARRLLDPSIQALRAIPSIAWVRSSSYGSAFSKHRNWR